MSQNTYTYVQHWVGEPDSHLTDLFSLLGFPTMKYSFMRSFWSWPLRALISLPLCPVWIIYMVL